MKRKFNASLAKPICFAIALGTLLLSSCKKEQSPDDQTSAATPLPQYPKPSDADAVLIALKSSVPSPVNIPSIPGMPTGGVDLTMELGMGIAVFKGNTKADKVMLNNTELKFTNGVHLWMPDYKNLTNPTSFTGIDLGGQIQWDVTNPTIKKTNSSKTGKPSITSAKQIDRSSGYTLTNQFSSGAQKIIYAIYSSNDKYILKEVDGGSTKITFSATELNTLSSTKAGILQANAYTISSETIGGKKVYFVKQNSYSVAGIEIK